MRNPTVRVRNSKFFDTPATVAAFLSDKAVAQCLARFAPATPEQAAKAASDLQKALNAAKVGLAPQLGLFKSTAAQDGHLITLQPGARLSHRAANGAVVGAEIDHGGCSCSNNSSRCTNCFPDTDGLPSNEGDLPGQRNMLLLRSVTTQCGAIINSRFQQQYPMLLQSFESAWANAKARAVSHEYDISAVSTGVPFTLTLNSDIGTSGLVTLGLSLRVALSQLGSNPTFSARFTGNLFPGGQFDTQPIILQADSSTGVMECNIYADRKSVV